MTQDLDFKEADMAFLIERKERLEAKIDELNDKIRNIKRKINDLKNG